MIKLKFLLETELKTLNGSVIKRYKNNVGKYISNKLYFHKQYATGLISNEIINNAISTLKQFEPNFKYNCIVYDIKDKSVRFDESPDFDTAREPHVGNYITIYADNKSPSVGYSNSIWHHKWLWVKDDYTGFDVNASKTWSSTWLSKLQEPAKGSDATWNLQLKKYNLS